MSTSRRFGKEISQIESIAETKGIDIDDIVVNETETKDGDEMIVFRVLETKAETEEDSVGVQISKVPSMQTGEMAFRNEVQNKLGALKRHLSGNNEEAVPDDTERDEPNTDDDYTGGPGAELDQRLQAVEDRLDDLESRVAAIEDKSEALDGLQKIVSQSDETDE